MGVGAGVASFFFFFDLREDAASLPTGMAARAITQSSVGIFAFIVVGVAERILRTGSRWHKLKRNPDRNRFAPRLINVAVGKLKGVPHQFQMWRGPFHNKHLDNIESEKDVWVVEQAKPGQAAERNTLSFRSAHGFYRPAIIFTGPRFHFHEDKRVVIATNHIDLAAAASAKIPIENFVAVPPQETAGQLFAARTQPKMPGPRTRKPAAPLVQTTGDGLDRGQTHEVYSGVNQFRNLCAG